MNSIHQIHRFSKRYSVEDLRYACHGQAVPLVHICGLTTAEYSVCDNLKTGVIKNKRHDDPVLNKSYEELTEHYNTALLPARVLAPKDKAAVEGSVGALTRRLKSKFRNKQFFSLQELNKSIRKELDEFNAKQFQKKDGSRTSVYEEEELPFMKPLPKYAYELATWKVATVQMNYHISFDKQNYSVPYAYVRKKVDVRSTSSVVEVYYQGTRICSHRRLYGRIGQYSTNVDHMPENHQLYSEWDSDRFEESCRNCTAVPAKGYRNS